MSAPGHERTHRPRERDSLWTATQPEPDDDDFALLDGPTGMLKPLPRSAVVMVEPDEVWTPAVGDLLGTFGDDVGLTFKRWGTEAVLDGFVNWAGGAIVDEGGYFTVLGGIPPSFYPATVATSGKELANANNGSAPGYYDWIADVYGDGLLYGYPAVPNDVPADTTSGYLRVHRFHYECAGPA